MTEPVVYSRSTATTFVIYDNKTGNIIHVHKTMALPGASSPSDEKARVMALELVHKIKGKATSEMDAIQISKDLEFDVRYKVDLQTKQLTEEKKTDLGRK
jgi:hypothetical protein